MENKNRALKHCRLSYFSSFSSLSQHAGLLPLGVLFLIFFLGFALLAQNVDFTGFIRAASPEFWESLSLSLSTSVLATLFSCALGLTLALLLARHGPGSRLARLLLQLNLGIPHFAVALLTLQLFSASGLVSRFIQSIAASGSGNTDRWSGLVYDDFGWGIILAHTLKETPFVAAYLFPWVQQGRTQFQEVAATLGARPFQRFRLLLLPYVLPALMLSAILVFCYSLGAFEIPYLLGKTYPKSISVLAYQAFTSLDLSERNTAYALALVTTLLALPAGAFVFFLQIRLSLRGFNSPLTPPLALTPRHTAHPPRWTKRLWPALRTSALWAALGVLPSLLILNSISDIWRWPDLLPSQFSLRAWHAWLSPDSPIFRAFTTSLGIAFTVSMLSVLIALLASLSLRHLSTEKRRFIESLSLIPILLPPFSIAIALFFAFLKIEVQESAFSVVLAHLIPVLPYVLQPISTSVIELFDPLDAQARSLGASRWQSFWRILLPGLTPVLLTTGTLAFLISLNQYLLTFFLGGGTVLTLPLLTLPLITADDRAAAASASLLLSLPAWLLLFISLQGPKLRPKKRRSP